MVKYLPVYFMQIKVFDASVLHTKWESFRYLVPVRFNMKRMKGSCFINKKESIISQWQNTWYIIPIFVFRIINHANRAVPDRPFQLFTVPRFIKHHQFIFVTFCMM